MKVLIVLCAAVAVCLAKPGYLGSTIVSSPVVESRVLHADSVPAGLAGLTAEGVPVDTPAVAAAKAAHFSVAGVASSRVVAVPRVTDVVAPAYTVADVVAPRPLRRGRIVLDLDNQQPTEDVRRSCERNVWRKIFNETTAYKPGRYYYHK